MFHDSLVVTFPFILKSSTFLNEAAKHLDTSQKLHMGILFIWNIWHMEIKGDIQSVNREGELLMFVKADQ